MSLLMDALKRAEQSKRQQQGGQPGPAAATDSAAELSLEQIDPGTRRSALPDLDSHLASLDADLTATAAENSNMAASPRPQLRSQTEASAQRNSAQNVFAAKEDKTPPASALTRLLVIGGIGVVALVSVGGYFYWQLQAISGAGRGLAAAPGAIHVARPIATTPVLPSVPANPSGPVAGASEATEPVKSSPPRAATRTGGPAPHRTPGVANKPEQIATASPTAKARNAATLPEPDLPATEALRVTTQTQDSPATRAHEALQAGQLEAARAGYQQALRADRKNADALVGLGTVLQRQGDSEGAERHFQQAIEADPRHAAAHAGLIAIRGASDPAAAESRLKTLINLQNSDPAAAGTLNFALGNVYAGQRRWNDAQQAYFKAFTSDAEHPDYLYNLAVSLDHLNQPALARQYYDQALQAGKKRPAAFDKAQGERRLAELRR